MVDALFGPRFPKDRGPNGIVTVLRIRSQEYKVSTLSCQRKHFSRFVLG